MNRWIIERAGLLNFWYYDEEEFSFSDGRLLLRGSNGSGKSVTMQSFIPLLLDGNKSPERLDPFGSKARKLENYLLGEEDSGRDENTGYLYMEFKKPSPGNYLTIGMGFRAVRGKSIQSWGFSITDGRRIGSDFYLYKDMGDKIPLSKKELENRIGNGGRVVEGQGEYMKMVNDLLFGYDEIDEYDELIKLLVQLRTPKLSKDFKPTVVYEIMENSLHQLSEDDLRPMSEAIENMDNIKGRLEELKESKKAQEKIKTIYDKYNNFILLDKAKSYVNTNKELEDLENQKDECERKKENAEKQYKDAEGKVEDLRLQQKTAEAKKKELDKHDSINIKEKLEGLENKIKELNNEEKEKQAQLDKKKRYERELHSKIIKCEDDFEVYKDKIIEMLECMDDLSNDFSFDEQSFMKEELVKEIDKAYSFTYIKDRFKSHMENLDKGQRILYDYKRKNEEYDNALKELEKNKEERNIKAKRLDEAQLLLTETKSELVEKIYTWKNKNREFMISDDAIFKVSRIINNFDENSSYDDAVSTVRDEYNNFEGDINKNISGFEFSLDNLKEDQMQLKIEIDEWKSKKEPEPLRDYKIELNRKRLEKEGIPFIPLYRAVDFNGDISLKMKGRIEEALLDIGILDALIVPSKYKNRILEMDENMADKYLFPSPKFLTHNLSELLHAEKVESFGISIDDVDNVLKSILLDDDGDSTYVNEKGEYGIGILKGRAARVYEPKFIGVMARKRYKEEMIKTLINQYDKLQEEINKIQGNIRLETDRLERISNEFKAFPSNADLGTAINTLREANFVYNKCIEEVNKREVQERSIYEEFKLIQRDVYELTSKINLPPEIDIYKEAIESGNEYRENLYEIENKHSVLIRNNEELGSLMVSIEQTEEDIENINGDLSINQRKQREADALHESYVEQLKLSDYEEIKNEIDECIRLIAQIPNQIENEITRREKENASYNNLVKELLDLDKKLLQTRGLILIYKKTFEREYGLGYFTAVEKNMDLLKAAKAVIREIKFDDKVTRDDLISTLHAKFQENNQYLREYIIRIEGIFEEDIDEADPALLEAAARSKRLDIKGKIRGRDVDFYSLLEFIKEGIEENERLLKESDRQLFEDILVKNISKKIRARIYHSEQWVRKMNELMESMDTSSGLSFSLRWSSKKAETEEQLDTKELVELLKQEGSLMKESDLNKLSEHFRSKISEARRIMEDSGKSQSFHSIMKDILDYRKWFEFKLYFVKTGQNKKELTNNAFYQFSGGEKAMAMYVPLFSAVYARYEGARKDCPRIISLDEAFAGVDEKNIRDMFRLLSQLNLDFLINSQILWGDYDTVPSLSICELIRPDNADYVTVIRYHWNGIIKSLYS